VPDVVVVDLRDLGTGGLVLIERISSLEESPAIVALTAVGKDPDMVGALRAGAIGCLPKSTPPEQLAGLVRAVAAGHTVLSLAATRRLVRSAARRQADQDRRLALVGKLSERELEILAALGEGLSNARIARRLHLRQTTVKSYVSMILDKLDCNNRTQAGLLALAAGLCSRPSR
jgi:DNA-binding NarL/FixJ family response regulator